ncbi:Hydrophobin [Mycena chlorophos]|uniref:Hydrophobin n=1 Tax=Mycena chlorophos TaxID=658473 RepID=A0A8H6S340_MYCCL|nr:Hydrophobin [Mycena chlorophos]
MVAKLSLIACALFATLVVAAPGGGASHGSGGKGSGGEGGGSTTTTNTQCCAQTVSQNNQQYSALAQLADAEGLLGLLNLGGALSNLGTLGVQCSPVVSLVDINANCNEGEAKCTGTQGGTVAIQCNNIVL